MKILKPRPPCSITHGEVVPPPYGLVPCLWIGLLDDGRTVIPWKPSQRGVAYDETTMKPGQFVFFHQCGGSRALYRTLAGILLPLSACLNRAVRTGLGRVANGNARLPHPFDLRPTSLTRLEKSLRSLGPLAATNSRRDTVEEYISLDCTTEFYAWARVEFRMATRLLIDYGLQEVEATKLEPLKWPDLPAFCRWLGRAICPVSPGSLRAALLYRASR